MFVIKLCNYNFMAGYLQVNLNDIIFIYRVFCSFICILQATKICSCKNRSIFNYINNTSLHIKNAASLCYTL